MVGQEDLINSFQTLTLNSLPHSMMFIGPYGCGKHTLCNYIGSKFNLQLYECSDKITIDELNIINSLKYPTLCVINGDILTDKEEAVLLKFIEEPNTNIFISILCSSESYILDTISNRCVIYRFKPYSQSLLNTFIDTGADNTVKQLILNIANTPGLIIKYAQMPILEMYNFSSKILDCIRNATLANIFNIELKVNLDEKNDSLYNLDVLSQMLKHQAFSNIKLNKPFAMQQYIITNKFCNNLKVKNINKKQLFEHYLYELKGVN